MTSRPVWGAWIEIVSTMCALSVRLKSRPVWGAWIEIQRTTGEFEGVLSRAPYGARGLKFFCSLSLPTNIRRAPYGARGLKCLYYRPVRQALVSRAPYGARGLKSSAYERRLIYESSRPVWGAWIEIFQLDMDSSNKTSRAPYGARGLKFCKAVIFPVVFLSRPVWGAWIEIRIPR